MTAEPVVRQPDPSGLAIAASALRRGRLVAFPTETVYGLGADALDPEAVARIYAAKGRPSDNPMIVHLADPGQIERVVERVTPLARRLANEYLPGPLTLVLDARPEIPRVTTGGLDTVAVRVPEHPVAVALLDQTARPVAAPSANRSGRPSPTTARHVEMDLGGLIAVILDGGPCPVGVESTIVDARGARPIVLREGSITREQLGVASAETTEQGSPAVTPGTGYRHYAPSCPVVIAAPGAGPARASQLREEGHRVGLVAVGSAPSQVVEIGRFRDASHLATQLYGALRAAEEAAIDVVVFEAVSPVGVGRAVMDRLRRAAEGAVGGSDAPRAGDRSA